MSIKEMKGNIYTFQFKQREKDEYPVIFIFRNNILVRKISLNICGSLLYMDLIKTNKADIAFLYIKEGQFFPEDYFFCICCNHKKREIDVICRKKDIPGLSKTKKIIENNKREIDYLFFPLWDEKSPRLEKEREILKYIECEGKIKVIKVEFDYFHCCHYSSKSLLRYFNNSSIDDNDNINDTIIGAFNSKKIPYILSTSFERRQQEEDFDVSALKFHLFYVNEINDDVVVKEIFTFEEPDKRTLLNFLNGKQNWFSYYLPSGEEQKVWITNGEVFKTSPVPTTTNKKTKRVIATT